mmetsp:Transcript_33158/g.95198  ORF Transcript_33158/g.95198 Transcript_33158/m.95198 type:complete len:141 (-) Transcript_33158:237-659(-)
MNTIAKVDCNTEGEPSEAQQPGGRGQRAHHESVATKAQQWQKWDHRTAESRYHMTMNLLLINGLPARWQGRYPESAATGSHKKKYNKPSHGTEVSQHKGGREQESKESNQKEHHIVMYSCQVAFFVVFCLGIFGCVVCCF